ncbi:hypothetical protein Pmani_035080 [Petrolisthes manimaculis]|uniref:lysozyme n=1 Tax=Petrolisthes manimaculis TaxID=1843537 RepID=A0AAE1NL91_9EUCA|nr:hypothetical protein Pmani_035080 [Petrolisthes manimaculis]
MSLIKATLLALTAATIFTFVYAAKLPNAQVPEQYVVQPNCLGCLCEASTNCNVTQGCHVPYAGAYFCGPFLISWAYWSDAGKPVITNDNPDRKGAFENCVNDLYCAAQTVRNYMANFSDITDCNGDGVLDCVDFAYIHNNGGFNCKDRSIITTSFYKNFDTCWNVVRAATAPIAASGVLPPSA